jgi:hypothetical protein
LHLLLSRIDVKQQGNYVLFSLAHSASLKRNNKDNSGDSFNLSKNAAQKRNFEFRKDASIECLNAMDSQCVHGVILDNTNGKLVSFAPNRFLATQQLDKELWTEELRAACTHLPALKLSWPCDTLIPNSTGISSENSPLPTTTTNSGNFVASLVQDSCLVLYSLKASSFSAPVAK